MGKKHNSKSSYGDVERIAEFEKELEVIHAKVGRMSINLANRYASYLYGLASEISSSDERIKALRRLNAFRDANRLLG